MQTKNVLITGITGMDGSILAEKLLERGYRVHGLVRRSSSSTRERLAGIKDHERLNLVLGDMTDATSIDRVIKMVKPDVVFNLAAQSHVGVSFENPVTTSDVTALGPLRILQALVQNGLEATRFYQASSSEMFGKVQEMPQKETTPFYPRSPYGVAKVAAYWYTVNYREAYGFHASNGILYNHECSRRDESFVTRKVTRWLARHLAGREGSPLFLGNLEAKRDWGSAYDYVDAMIMIADHFTPGDYIIATNETHSVREFLEEAFTYVGLLYEDHVRIDPKFYRPTEVDVLQGDYTKAKEVLGWEPKTKFRDLVRQMVEADLQREGIRTPNPSSGPAVVST